MCVEGRREKEGQSILVVEADREGAGQSPGGME